MARILARNAYKGDPFEHAHVAFTFSVGDNRRHDLDNLIASTKPITDGLVGVLFVDDSIDKITVSYAANRDKPRGIRIVVTRTECP